MENEHQKFGSDIIKDADGFLIYVFDDNKTLEPTRREFDEIEVAQEFKADLLEITNSEQRKVITNLTSKVSFLDSLIEPDEKPGSKLPKKQDNSGGNFLDPPVDTMFGMSLELYEEKYKKIRKKFKKKRHEFEEKAKAALLEAAKIFLGDKHEEAYVKYKLELTQRGLGAIMYQIFTMEDTLHSIAARIKVSGGHFSSHDIEVATGLHRVILEAQKFQFEYLQIVESSLKELRADYDLLNHTGPQAIKDEENVLFIRGSKEFIKQLHGFRNEFKDFVPTPSKNKNLNPLAETVTQDTAFEEIDGKKESIIKNPMTGYEGAKKRTKKERDEFGEEGEEQDFDI